MNKAVVGVIVALVVIVLGIFLVLGGNSPSGEVVTTDDEMQGTTLPPTSGSVEMGEEDITFVVTGENFKFVVDGEDNPTIRVNQGDLVRIEFESTQGFHDWVVDEFNVATTKVRDTDASTFVEFVADKVGTFEYYCSIGEHRANGMKGMLIVS